MRKSQGKGKGRVRLVSLYDDILYTRALTPMLPTTALAAMPIEETRRAPRQCVPAAEPGPHTNEVVSFSKKSARTPSSIELMAEEEEEEEDGDDDEDDDDDEAEACSGSAL